MNINYVRQEAVVSHFRQSLGKRIFLLTAEFPFMVIGVIKKVVGDYVFVDVETTHIDQFENMVIRIHIDRIEVFFVEDKCNKIPNIDQDPVCFENRGEEK